MRPNIARIHYPKQIGWFVCAGLCLAAFVSLTSRANGATPSRSANFGTINGSVRDSKGNPLAGAVISLVKQGAQAVAKEIRSAADGTFVAKIAPGRYVMSAAADGFGAYSFDGVEVKRAEQLYYRFNLVPVGAGRTLPERRTDRDSAKWRLRSAQSRRSILQIDGSEQTVAVSTGTSTDDTVGPAAKSDSDPDAIPEERRSRARTQGVVETYFSSTQNPNLSDYAGVNFAVFQPVNQRLDLIFSGQFASTRDASRRFDATARLRLNSRHRANVSFGSVEVGRQMLPSDQNGSLNQVSLRAVDEWVVRDGIVVVMGLDYSRFTGLSNDASISPRLGLQFDANATTRIKMSFAPGGAEDDIQNVAGFEGGSVVFRNLEGQPMALVGGQAVIEKSLRLEFGVERILDRRSSVEATMFFDTTSGRGLGLLATPVSSLNGSEPGAIERLANQEGSARGLRVVYSLRLSSIFSTSAGYSFGRGQRLSSEGITDPSALFENSFFQAAAAQLTADFDTGTRVQTVFRFSPGATVFAIDPFAGRLAVYDPSLSIMVTQELPTFGLPVRAEAVLNARNVLDSETSANDGTTRMTINANRRILRGGILVRF
ncbi:MAG: carboxypeptidase-like regulatory domain-containing protein [Pyrinomonadaceae bacterium]